jgi:hypothetical protein
MATDARVDTDMGMLGLRIDVEREFVCWAEQALGRGTGPAAREGQCVCTSTSTQVIQVGINLVALGEDCSSADSDGDGT